MGKGRGQNRTRTECCTQRRKTVPVLYRGVTKQLRSCCWRVRNPASTGAPHATRMKIAGVSRLSLWVRPAAGWIRISKWSKESPPWKESRSRHRVQTAWPLICARAATSSGKYRVRGLPAFDNRSMCLRSPKVRQRKPSHLGSYCHCGAVGSADAGWASMGR